MQTDRHTHTHIHTQTHRHTDMTENMIVAHPQMGNYNKTRGSLIKNLMIRPCINSEIIVMIVLGRKLHCSILSQVQLDLVF